MNRENFKKIVAVATALGISVGLSGCDSKKNYDENGIPIKKAIEEREIDYGSRVEDRTSFVISNGEVVKVYKSSDIYFFVNKETSEISEYLYYPIADKGSIIYDINNEEYIYYQYSLFTGINDDFYKYLKENYYFVPLTSVIDSILGMQQKEYYSIDEINEIKEYVNDNEVIKTKHK